MGGFVWLDALGFAAGILTTCSFLPQVIKTAKTKKVRDISLKMYMIMSVGITLWLLYGFFVSSLPIMMANGVSLLLVATIVIMKLKYERNDKRRYGAKMV